MNIQIITKIHQLHCQPKQTNEIAENIKSQMMNENQFEFDDKGTDLILF